MIRYSRRKKHLLILLIILVLLTACSDAGFISGGVDSNGHEIIYKKLTVKQVENTEKIQVMISWAQGGRYAGIEDCQYAVQVTITDIDTIIYKRKNSPSERLVNYFSIIRGEVISVYRGEDELSPGDNIDIKAEESMVYIGDFKMQLSVGNTYYMFLMKNDYGWKSKLAVYRHFWSTDNYKQMMSYFNE